MKLIEDAGKSPTIDSVPFHIHAIPDQPLRSQLRHREDLLIELRRSLRVILVSDPLST
jgi:hypothetical protein